MFLEYYSAKIPTLGPKLKKDEKFYKISSSWKINFYFFTTVPLPTTPNPELFLLSLIHPIVFPVELQLIFYY